MNFNHFDRAVVIGLHRVAQFYKQFYIGHLSPAEFGPRWIPPYDHPIQLFRGINATKFMTPAYWGNEIPSLWGCGESHRQVIARALSDDVKTILIMEDDCQFAETHGATDIFNQFLAELPEDWDGIMFGGQVAQLDGKTEPISEHVSRCLSHVERLHCYALSRSGMQKFHDLLCEPTPEANDYRWGRAQEQGLMTIYRCEPFIAYQAEGESAISGRREANRIWDDRVDVRLRDPKEIPIISLVCPFEVMEKLRDRAIISNGGDSPPHMAAMAPGRVEQGEIRLSELMLDTVKFDPTKAMEIIGGLRNDTAFHRRAAFALWHPTEFIPFPGAINIKTDNFDDAVARIVHLIPE